uniref:Orofacial cleft 1 candidate gene 1 protein n=1 Tax=Nothobranchius furzeri TaxID=105023 RepID=A0A8C6VTI0_NOTFU
IHLTISLQKLQQKALQQPKQKKSKSAEFLMGEEERTAAVGIENPAFSGGGSAELSVSPSWLGRKMRGDRPDSTLAAHQKKSELQAPAKERGNQRARNYFDPPSAEQTDPRQCAVAGVSGEDELELTMMKADESRLYERMAALLDDDDTFIDLPGTLQASRDEEVLEVKAGDLVLQRQRQLHSGGGAWGTRPSQASAIAKAQAEGSVWLGGETGLQAGRMVTGRERAVKTRPAEEAIPCYTQQLRERVQPDMITLGSLSLQQQPAQKGTQKRSEWASRKKRLMAVFSGNAENYALNNQNKTFSVHDLSQENQRSVPQPVEVLVCCLRSTRDKLPRGLYSVSVALHRPLGGPALALWSERGQQIWAVSTEPTEHRGRFYDTDLHFNQNLFMNLPAACDINPSMVLVFQLISQHHSHLSSAVAWGVFPLCGSNLNLVHGRFKTPLLRGEPSARLGQFKKIEALISSDLDHWLCNLYFQIKRLPCGTSGEPGLFVAPSTSSSNSPVMSKPEVHYDRSFIQMPHQPQPSSHSRHLCSGPSCRAGEPTAAPSHQGSPLRLSADSACSSSSLPGRKNPGENPLREKAEDGVQFKKKPIKKTNSCGPSASGRGAAPLQERKQKMQEKLSAEEMEGFTFFLQSSTGLGSCPPRLSDRARLALSMLPSELGLLLLRQQHQLHTSWHDSALQLGLIMLLLALMWFVRLYLHYCSQWLYLQAIAVPVNKFQLHAHTVELIYQSSLLHTREELTMVVVGPLTLNAVTLLLVLIRWGCQLIFGSLPSFTSNFIMAQGVWTVLDPLAVFTVDAVLGRLAYSPDTPVGDAAKLYWHFYRAERSGAAGVIITLFLYTVHFLLSITILAIYLLRFHNDGRMLDTFQRLTAKEGMYFLPHDLELSNQELSYIVKKAEQWRGFNGERRKVAVYDHIWTAEDPLLSSGAPSDGEGAPPPEGETSTHVIIYTLYPSGIKQRYRHFLRQPDGAITEVRLNETALYSHGLTVALLRKYNSPSLFFVTFL